MLKTKSESVLKILYLQDKSTLNCIYLNKLLENYIIIDMILKIFNVRKLRINQYISSKYVLYSQGCAFVFREFN